MRWLAVICVIVVLVEAKVIDTKSDGKSIGYVF